MEYSGVPTRLPLKSAGALIPESVLMKMQEWRKKREGKTGRPTKTELPRLVAVIWFDKDISEASNS
jgi:hypothetical protein